MQEHLLFLKDFVEGRRSLDDWNCWWNENSECLSAAESRKCYLRLKHTPFSQACAILKEFGVPFQRDMSKCEKCGAPLFVAAPHVTTVEEIVEFARGSNLPYADRIIAENWIHPGQYCPNGCICIIHNYGSLITDDDAD